MIFFLPFFCVCSCIKAVEHYLHKQKINTLTRVLHFMFLCHAVNTCSISGNIFSYYELVSKVFGTFKESNIHLKSPYFVLNYKLCKEVGIVAR